MNDRRGVDAIVVENATATAVAVEGFSQPNVGRLDSRACCSNAQRWAAKTIRQQQL